MQIAFFVAILLFNFSSFAQTPSSTIKSNTFTQFELDNIRYACEQKNKKECDRKYLNLAKLQSQLCEVDFKNNKCAEKIKKNSDESWRYKRCDETSLCLQNQYEQSEGLMACFLGATELPRQLGGLAIDAAKNLPTALSNYAKKVSSSISDREKMLKNCNKSIECKRILARGNPTTLALADPKNQKELEKYPAIYLWSKNKEYAPFRVQLMIHGGMSKEQYYKEIGLVPKEYSQIKNLNIEESINLLATWESVKKFVEDQYEDVMCFSPLEKTRLTCSVLTDVLSGVAIEKALALRSAKAAARATDLVERSADKILIRRLAETSLNKSEIVRMYAQKNSTSVLENQSWVDFISSGSKQKNVTIENSALKNMNDKIFKDEEFVTSLTNMYKEIQIDKFKALELEMQKKNPAFKFQYFSDYKGVRLAYEDVPGIKIEDEIQKIITTSNKEYADLLLSKNIVRAEDNPAKWFKGSIAKSDDLANLAARFARNSEDSMFVNAGASPAFDTWVKTEFNAGKKLQSEVMSSFKGTRLVVDESSQLNLHRDAIEILRKNKDNPTEAKRLIEQKFGLQNMSEQNFSKLSGYFDKIDSFSPGLRGVQREFATLSDSSHGGLSIDMIGLGADHLQQTSSKAFASAKNIDEFLATARQGETALTADVASRKKAIEFQFKKITGDPEAVVTCSGDGCKAYLKNRVVTEKEAQQFSDRLTANNGESGKLRFSQVSGLQTSADADLIAKRGEDIEKAIRQSAAGTIDLKRLSGMNFTVQIKSAAAEAGGRASVHVSTAEGLTLSKSEKEILEKIMNSAVKAQGYSPK